MCSIILPHLTFMHCNPFHVLHVVDLFLMLWTHLDLLVRVIMVFLSIFSGVVMTDEMYHFVLRASLLPLW